MSPDSYRMKTRMGVSSGFHTVWIYSYSMVSGFIRHEVGIQIPYQGVSQIYIYSLIPFPTFSLLIYIFTFGNIVLTRGTVCIHSLPFIICRNDISYILHFFKCMMMRFTFFSIPFFFFNLHSHITSNIHPMLLSRLSFLPSLLLLDSSFGSQYLLLVFGRDERLQPCLCQKQPRI